MLPFLLKNKGNFYFGKIQKRVSIYWRIHQGRDKFREAINLKVKGHSLKWELRNNKFNF